MKIVLMLLLLALFSVANAVAGELQEAATYACICYNNIIPQKSRSLNLVLELGKTNLVPRCLLKTMTVPLECFLADTTAQLELLMGI